MENHLLLEYVSPILDQNAVRKDTFIVDWNRWESIYPFPPTPMILWVLDKMSAFNGRAFVVALFWPNQPWFPLLMSR